MNRSILPFLVFALCASTAFCQSQFYYSDDGIHQLEQSLESFIIFTESGEDLQGLAQASFAPGLKEVKAFPHKKYAVLTPEDQLRSPLQIIEDLGLKSATIDYASAYKLEDGFTMYPTHQIVFRLSHKDNLAQIMEIVNEYDYMSLESINGVHRLVLSRVDDAFEVSNKIYETGLVRFSHPDFYATITHYNDPRYPDQFQMNNTGQTIDGVTGVNDMDCNAPEAWAISLGSASITVAVIDDGLEDHEDMENSSGQSRYTNGFSPANNGNGDAISGSNHGVSCAGIVAASHNTIGVRGVAPLVDLISVNIFVGGESTQDIADGITWAKDNGADVLSNSWGYTSCNVNYSNIGNAIADANSNGRGGKGCLVIFASGNGYKSCVDFPAKHPDAVAVGAFTNQGVRSSYSNYGTDLDIMAPSNAVSPQPGAGVRTTDRMGGPGYNSTNYTNTFGGTSAACPVVAGVCALALGYNPDVTSAALKTSLYNTAIDMGPNGDDNEYASGRVNAQAVLNDIGGGGGGPTCSDGLQNGSETGVDCGGPDCPPCSSGCDDTEVTLTILTDNYPGETTWELSDDNGNVLASGGPYSSSGTTYTEDFCLADGCYNFTIFDSYGDGICCAYGSGSYDLASSSETFASGGAFGSSESTDFCIGNSGPTCDDGVQNGDETGIDCGGSVCPPCGGGGSETVFAHFFESGWDGWQDGGSDCYRYSGSRSWEGNYSIRLRDNSGTRSAMTSSTYDLSGYNSVELEFYFYPNSMENGEDFWVRYNSGSGWQTVATYASGSSFNNGSFYVATVTLDDASYNLTNNARFRFQCDASGNGDQVYIDEVTLTGIGASGSYMGNETDEPTLVGVMPPSLSFEQASEDELRVIPNPASELITITADEEIEHLSIYSLEGKLVYDRDVEGTSVQIDISGLQVGSFYISAQTEEEIITKTLIKQ